jgi:outer membrane lipoprotein-sorting protein
LKRVLLLLASLLLSAEFVIAAEPRGSAPFGESYARLFRMPFHVSATLSIRRAAWSRNLALGVVYRDRERAFVRVSGSEREMGTVVLRREGRIYLYFPRAELLLSLPPHMESFPLFGSDFSTDDLLAFGDFASRFNVTGDGEDTLSGVPAYRYRLTPLGPAALPYAEIRLWVARDGKTPLREEFLSPQGTVAREILMESDGRLPFPARWRARTFGAHGGESELQFRSFMPNPPVKDDLFTVEGLRQWR